MEITKPSATSAFTAPTISMKKEKEKKTRISYNTIKSQFSEIGFSISACSTFRHQAEGSDSGARHMALSQIWKISNEIQGQVNLIHTIAFVTLENATFNTY